MNKGMKARDNRATNNSKWHIGSLKGNVKGMTGRLSWNQVEKDFEYQLKHFNFTPQVMVR